MNAPVVSSVKLSDAGAAHAELVAALHALTIGAEPAARGGDAKPWRAAFVARLLALPGVFAMVAAAPDPVGFVLCLPAGDAVDIAAIGVVAAARRRGIGQCLVAAAAARARGAGAERLMLEVAADNAPAIALYRAAGFAETGRRPAYYAAAPTSAPRDALVLSKTL